MVMHDLWRHIFRPVLLAIFALGCTHAIEPLDPGECREDVDCPERLICNKPGGRSVELGTCGCNDDIDCPHGLMCDLEQGRCTDGEGCASGRCCLTSLDCNGCLCHAGVCISEVPSLGGIYDLCEPGRQLDASPPLDMHVVERDALPALNACHGLSVLPLGPRLGESCECGGTWACNGPDSVACTAPLNASDPRDETQVTLGERCDSCGHWACIDGKVRCVGKEVDGTLRSIGDWWLIEAGGRWQCRRLSCDGDADGREPLIVTLEDMPCGGCRAPLETEGEPCGKCPDANGRGVWTCTTDADGRPVLDGTGMPLMHCAGEGTVNVCGGCGELAVEATFGQPCGPCGTGRYGCQDRSTLVCVGAQAQPDDCDGVDDDCDGTIDEDVVPPIDISHCRECGRPCLFEHGEGRCDDGECVLHRCDDGFSDANQEAADGCECQRRSIIDRCGDGVDDDCDGRVDECTCDEQCQALGRSCPAGGGCEPTCPPGSVDLDRQRANGCECVQRAVICDDRDDDCDGDLDEHDACP